MRLSLQIVLCSFYVVSFEGCSGYRILGIFPLNARSHMMMFEELMKGLARKGHQVDVVSAFPRKTSYKNYADIAFSSELPKLMNNVSFLEFEKSFRNGLVDHITRVRGNEICEERLKTPRLQEIIKNPPTNPSYDLVIVEYLSAPCFIAFGHHLGVPVIGISSSALYPWGNGRIGNPDNLAFTPNNLLNFSNNMTFWERFYNVIHTFYYNFFFDYFTSLQDEIVRKHFGHNTPGVRELEKSLALVLTNTHPIFNGVKPVAPAVIEVGGLHVRDDGPEIPAVDKKWLDESEYGFVYFTFGSMVTIESFPHDVLLTFYKSFEKIAPVRVLMKIPQPELLPPGLPNNVQTFSWINQKKVLKHKNIRAFISHAGLMGAQEAITYAVPIIGIPLFADQFINVDLLVKKNVAIKLNYNDIAEEKLDAALNGILNNPIYREKVKELSAQFLDRPLNALDTAIFWIEFVVKHGSKALRSSALDLTWWQIALLDVHGTLLLSLILIFTILISLARYFLFILCVEKTHASQSSRIKKMS